MNIRSMLQIKNGLAVISAKDMAILVGRKHLSILRAIDLIPEQYLTNEMFFMIDDEVFIRAYYQYGESPYQSKPKAL